MDVFLMGKSSIGRPMPVYRRVSAMNLTVKQGLVNVLTEDHARKSSIFLSNRSFTVMSKIHLYKKWNLYKPLY